MKRRELIALAGGAAASCVSWPRHAFAQQPERVRRLGMLIPFAENDDETQKRIAAFLQSLRHLGWADGRNLRITHRWSTGGPELYRRYSEELVALSPDVILATTMPALSAILDTTRTVPVVFVQVVEPVGAGLVASLARPGGNATGFTQFEYSLSTKWLELLKELAPQTTRLAVIRDPSSVSGVRQLETIQAAAEASHIEVTAIDGRDAGEIERAIGEFARAANGGLVIASNPAVGSHREVIIASAARHHLPAVYPYRYMVADGGLISYGPDTIDPYRRAASYVDRILKGEKPADLPVQAPTKYELAINLKTAKSLDLDIPPTLLALADEVIE